MKPKIIVILGPTASGKSDLAVEIARKFNGEVISADSRQIYKELDLASGKISEEEMRGVPHHMLDITTLKSRGVYSTQRFQREANKIIKEIITRGHLPVICGGTGFYIDALLYGQKFPKVAPNKKLRAELEKLSVEKLFKKLKKLDPRRAANIDAKNPHRLIRAIEIANSIGSVPPIIKKEKYDALKMGFKLPHDKLEKRIAKRLNKRLNLGMTDEIRKIRQSGIDFKKLEALGLEPKCIALYLQGKISESQMKDAIIRESMRYAKRQMTWFKRNKDIYWVKDKKEALALVKKFTNSESQ